MAHHDVDLSGDYRSTIYAAARRLMAKGAAAEDTLSTWGDGKLSMSGVVGNAPGLRFGKRSTAIRSSYWLPIGLSTYAVSGVAAKTGLRGIIYRTTSK